MATRKAPSKATKVKKAKAGLLRGVALVEAVMASRDEPLDPMPAAELSPALKRWLEHDGALFALGAAEPFSEMVAREFGEEWAEISAELEELKAPVVLFEGWTDAHGEYT
jgi:hypothetical protein